MKGAIFDMDGTLLDSMQVTSASSICGTGESNRKKGSEMCFFP